MFISKFPQAQVKLPSCTVSLSATLPVALTKYLRDAQAKRIGRVLRKASSSEGGGADFEPGNSPIEVLESTLLDLKTCEAVLEATRAELHNLNDASSAISSGVLPAEPSPLSVAAAECFGLAELIRRQSPASSLAADEYNSAKDALSKAVSDLERAYQSATINLDKARSVLEKAAKAAFAHHDDLGDLIAKGYHQYLPGDWRALIKKGMQYSIATYDPYSKDASQIAASVIQNKFRKHLSAEYVAIQKRTAKAKDSLRKTELKIALKEATE